MKITTPDHELIIKLSKVLDSVQTMDQAKVAQKYITQVLKVFKTRYLGKKPTYSFKPKYYAAIDSHILHLEDELMRKIYK